MVISSLKKLGRFFTFSSCCWLCHLPLVYSPSGICQACYHLLKHNVSCCPRCGLPSEQPQQECGRCLQHPPFWQQLVFVSDYQTPLKQLVHQFKYQGMWQLAKPLAYLLLLSYLQARRERLLIKPDIIVSVPLYRYRHWRRGFNQSELLAKPLAHWLNCAYQPKVLIRTRATKSQQTLNATARKKNLRGAFCCTQDLTGKHILLLDDVVTTGATINELSRLLQLNGAASVQVICLCRTL